jgi:hypothetical protein
MFTRSNSFFDHFRPSQKLRWVFAAALLTATAGAIASADAATRFRPGAYDGTWNVQFATRAGNCGSNSVPFTVAGRTVSSAGGGKVSGGITEAGHVSVAISVGASHATGRGRLAGTSGTGYWSGIITGDRCSGTWLATRS